MPESKPKFKKGDAVQLKIGGPAMTVYKIDANRVDDTGVHYECQWFAGKKLEDGWFAEESLKVADEQQSK